MSEEDHLRVANFGDSDKRPIKYPPLEETGKLTTEARRQRAESTSYKQLIADFNELLGKHDLLELGVHIDDAGVFHMPEDLPKDKLEVANEARISFINEWDDLKDDKETLLKPESEEESGQAQHSATEGSLLEDIKGSVRKADEEAE